MTRGATYTRFQELFNSMYKELCNYAYSYMEDRGLAEDVVQETFIKLWQIRPALIEKGEEIKLYLYVAVRNNCISQLRKKKLPIVSNEVLDYTADMEDTGPGHQDEDMRAYYWQLLQEAIATLPPKCRDVFLHCKITGLSYKHAAAKLGISAKTVENQMVTAYKKIREYLKKYNLPLWLLPILLRGICFF